MLPRQSHDSSGLPSSLPSSKSSKSDSSSKSKKKKSTFIFLLRVTSGLQLQARADGAKANTRWSWVSLPFVFGVAPTSQAPTCFLRSLGTLTPLPPSLSIAFSPFPALLHSFKAPGASPSLATRGLRPLDWAFWGSELNFCLLTPFVALTSEPWIPIYAPAPFFDFPTDASLLLLPPSSRHICVHLLILHGNPLQRSALIALQLCICARLALGDPGAL